MDINLEKVDHIVNSYGNKADMLIQILQDVQTEYNWLPKEVIVRVCEKLQIPISRAYRIATFYTLFSLEPRGRHLVNVCLGTACHVRGGPRILEKTQDIMGICAGQTTSDMRYTLERVNCLGCCALGPVMTVDGEAFGKLAVKDVESILNTYE